MCVFTVMRLVKWGFLSMSSHFIKANKFVPWCALFNSACISVKIACFLLSIVLEGVIIQTIQYRKMNFCRNIGINQGLYMCIQQAEMYNTLRGHLVVNFFIILIIVFDSLIQNPALFLSILRNLSKFFINYFYLLFFSERKQKIEDIKKNIRDAILVCRVLF